MFSFFCLFCFFFFFLFFLSKSSWKLMGEKKSIFLFISWGIKCLNTGIYSFDCVVISLLLANLFKKGNLYRCYVGNTGIWHYSYSWRNLILRCKTDILLFSSFLPFQVSSYLAVLWMTWFWCLCKLIIHKVCCLNNFSSKYICSDF